MYKNYDQVVQDFEVAISQMQKDLQYLADQKKFSPKFFDKQNSILKSIIDYYNRTQANIQNLKEEVVEYRIAKREQIAKYENQILCYEAICIIHGVIDFPVQLSKGKGILLYEAEQLGKDKKMKLPELFTDKLKLLSKKEQATIMDILHKELNAELDTLLYKINTEGDNNFIINAIRTQRNKTK